MSRDKNMRFLNKKPSRNLKNRAPKKFPSPVFDILAIFGVERNSNNAAASEPAGHYEPPHQGDRGEETTEEWQNSSRSEEKKTPRVEGWEDEPEVMQEQKEEAPEELMSATPIDTINSITVVETVHPIARKPQVETRGEMAYIPEWSIQKPRLESRGNGVHDTVPEIIREEALAVEKIETPQTNATTENYPQKISIRVTEDEETPQRHIPETFVGADDSTYHEQNLVQTALESEIKMVDTPEEYKNIEEVLVAKDTLWTEKEILAKNTRPAVIETPSQKYFNILDTNLMTAAPNPEEEAPSQEPPQEIDRESYEKIVCETAPQTEIDPEAEKTVVPIKIGEEEKSSEPYASKSFYVTLS